MKIIKLTLAMAILAGLTACGGGGGDSGSSLYGGGSGAGTDTGSTTGTGSVASSTTGTVALALSSTTISASTPGTVTAQVKLTDGTPIVGTIVKFSVPGGKASVSPDSVITDSLGNASAQVVPITGAVGADYVNATADVRTSTSLSARSAFTVTSVTTTLGAITSAPSSLPAYGSSVISVAVVGASAASPVTVNFSSTCASAGKAVLSPASVTVTGGTAASITYQDQACGSTDRINASIVGTSQQQQVNLPVASPAAQSLQFVSASPGTICLAGSGCPDTSLVSFKLLDQFNAPISGADVSFALDIAGVAQLSLTSTKTDSNGLATVSVTAKTLPTPVRVKATMGATLATVSNALAINAGLPTQRSVSFSAQVYNVDGWAKDGTESVVRLQLNDRFGNAVPDGTAVSLVAEGASVIPASCLTVSGVCTVKFISSNFRPSNGRVSVTAFAQGEESFDDQNGDNLYTTGEPVENLGEVYIDRDESGSMNATGEFLVGAPVNTSWDGNTFVRASRVFTLSDSSRFPRLYAAAGGVCSSTRLTSATALVFTMRAGGSPVCRVQQEFCMRDANSDADALGGNPVPAAAILALATKAKGATAQVDNSPIPSTVTGPTRHVVTVDLDDCTKFLEAAGSLDLSVTMPGGQKYTIPIGSIQ